MEITKTDFSKVPASNISEVKKLLKQYNKTKSPYLAYRLSAILGYEPDTKDIYGRYIPKPDMQRIQYLQSLPTSEFF
jgi:hypothetical protein